MSTNTPESVIPEGDDANDQRTGTDQREAGDTSMPDNYVDGDHGSNEPDEPEAQGKGKRGQKQRQQQ